MNALCALLATMVGLVERDGSRERGATAVEYGILVSLIAGVVVAIVATLGTETLALFQSIQGKF